MFGSNIGNKLKGNHYLVKVQNKQTKIEDMKNNVFSSSDNNGWRDEIKFGSLAG